jgi:hypothetical protein
MEQLASTGGVFEKINTGDFYENFPKNSSLIKVGEISGILCEGVSTFELCC